ncbi:triose-phosphate isomerase [Flavobacteriaceae bacterium R38]|nr:triose-phosphate isomerase [Flavobacteriaceae bacterium R38]
MRKNIVAGNWKMNNDLSQTKSLISDLLTKVSGTETKVMIAPAFTNLHIACELTKQSPIEVAAQNMHFAENGAYTGEVSASMLKSIGVNTVILGHSERRAQFREDDAILAKKIDAALQNDMTIIFCFGEELEDRNSGNHFAIVKSQLKNALSHLETKDWENIILAYEPVWAIGTGVTATPDQAQEMHYFVRKMIDECVGGHVADNTSVLYGGSVKPDNAKEIFSKSDVDGGLIGGASLNADDFMTIIDAFNRS